MARSVSSAWRVGFGALLVTGCSLLGVDASADRCIYFFPAELHALHDPYCNGGPSWLPIVSRKAACSDPSNVTPTFCNTYPNGAEANDWYLANYPHANLSDRCTPWSGSYSECDAEPTPNTCQDAPETPKDSRNEKASCAGDPVDLTTGHLEQRATDLDLGRGLAFARFYSNGSNAPPAASLGPKWRHGLDWRLYRNSLVGSGTATSPLVESVVVKRPFATPVSFVRQTWAPPVGSEPWKAGARGSGGLTGDSSTGFVYTDGDGTKVTFAATTFAVTKIQRPVRPRSRSRRLEA